MEIFHLMYSLSYLMLKCSLLYCMVLKIGAFASYMIEKLHIFAMKKTLGVGMRTPNDLINGELGRFPIYINAQIRCVRYWLKLTRMSQQRLPFKAYKIFYNLDERGKTNWVSNAQCLLNSYGFRYVWDCHGVGHIDEFLKVFRQRLISCRWQCLDDHIQTSERSSFYKKFKTSYEMELDINSYVKCSLTRFRFEISDIYVHCTRYKSNVTAREMVCSFCSISIKNEVHFVLYCPGLDGLRRRYNRQSILISPVTFV